MGVRIEPILQLYEISCVVVCLWTTDIASFSDNLYSFYVIVYTIRPMEFYFLSFSADFRGLYPGKYIIIILINIFSILSKIDPSTFQFNGMSLIF